MGIKIRIPKHIWHGYQPATLAQDRRHPEKIGLKIRIPAHIWNAYQPQPPVNTHIPSGLTPKLKLKLRIQPTLSPFHRKNSKRWGHLEAQRDITSCKVKLFRFHHGGPRRQQKGRWQNRITYEQPCLMMGCASCRKWHSHLIRNRCCVQK
jgi:hypothetical protein